uniref:DUF669 domain-containing protein n=1 Tax=Dulem virus 38 TaxID=3145756 RepID=A0AAU8B2H8_9CAUD
MALTFDFTNYKDTSTAHVPAGTYHAEVSDFEETTSKAGNAMFVVYLEIIEGPHAGQQIIDRLPQTARAMFRSAAFLQALGVKIAKKKFTLNPKSLIGRPVDILVEDGEPYNGRVKSEVREYLRATKPVKQAEPDPLGDEDAEDSYEEPAEEPQAQPGVDSADDVELDVDALDIDDLDL